MGITGQGHSFTLAKDHLDFKIKTCFCQELLGHLKLKFI